jgi:hypothetical protein
VKRKNRKRHRRRKYPKRGPKRVLPKADLL